MEVLAVIPARGGSKRVANKNIRNVGGKPLIAYTIEQARMAVNVDRAIVSTEDPKIQSVAEEFDGDVPFRRPDELATDYTKSSSVVEHALEWANKEGLNPEIIAMLQVTTPLRRASDIDNAIQRLQRNSDAKSVISITKYQNPPYWAVEQDTDGFLRSHFEPDILWTDDPPRSQELQTLSYPNGAIFAAESKAFRAENSFYTEATIPYEMPAERAIDIDEPFELEMVRALMTESSNK